MNHAARRFLSVVTSLAASIICLPACSTLPDSEELIAAPDEDVGNSDYGVSGSQAVGSTLIATTNVNLRSGPSTSSAVLHVVPSGSSVTVMESAPQNGFYKVKHNGTVGWSSATYYEAAPAAPSVTAADLLAELSSCQQLAGTTKFKSDAGSSSTIPLCGLSGAIWWKADLDVDCDGGTSAVCKSDPTYQAQTAATDSKGKPLDASKLPFVVIPGTSKGFNYKTAGLKMGSVVAVIYQDKLSFGILGDVGPMGVIGEASYATAVELGINPSPTSGGVDSGVTYIAFTGAAAVVTTKEDHAEAVQLGNTLSNQFINAN